MEEEGGRKGSPDPCTVLQSITHLLPPAQANVTLRLEPNQILHNMHVVGEILKAAC